MAYAMIGNAPRPKKIYIATQSFEGAFYSYTVTGPTAANLTTTGRLALLSASNSAVTAVTCPAGRLLREIGASLYPGVNPGLKVGDTNYNASAGEHRWVKVYDAITGFNGYIDPNGAGFATYSTDRPEEFADINESNGATGANARLGQSVYTAGNIIAVGQIRSSTSTPLATTSPANINGTLGQVFTLAQPASTAMTINCGTVPPSGSVVYVVITPAGIAALITWGTNIKGLNVTPTAGKVTTCSFVSDGTNLNQFGAITSS